MSGRSRTLDGTLGLVVLAVGGGVRAARTLGRAARPAAEVLLEPPGVPAVLRPGRVLRAVAERGRAEREHATRVAERFVRALVPRVLDAVLDEVDLTTVVLQRVDLDQVAGAIPVDAVVDRVDIDRIVSRIDVDAIAARVDVDAIVARLDIDSIVDRVDVNGIVDKVDLDAVVDRLDLVGLTQEVIDAIDLPELISASTGSMASVTVRGLRMHSIGADEQVNRIVDRLLLRSARRTDGPGRPGPRAEPAELPRPPEPPEPPEQRRGDSS